MGPILILLAQVTSVFIQTIADPLRGFSIPLLDLSDQKKRQIIVDKERGQYLGHPSTVLLEDGETILCVYPKGHGKGGIVYKKSTDGGFTWSKHLRTPPNWSTSKEVPTIHRVIDSKGVKRLILWSGLYPARISVSENDGDTSTPLKQVGDWGGIVVMGSVEKLAKSGHYLAMFHDDGRFFKREGKRANPTVFTLLQTFSKDGGLSWTYPQDIMQRSDIHLCEPGIIRSPEGKEIAALLRENSRRKNSHVIFSKDERLSWSEPIELPGSLTGDRHTSKYGPDGRLFISFRDMALETPTKGDWVGWVGTCQDIKQGKKGQYRIRLMDNKHGWDCAYPPVEILPNGTFVTTTYGHWTHGEKPYIVSIRFRLEELDEIAKGLK